MDPSISEYFSPLWWRIIVGVVVTLFSLWVARAGARTLVWMGSLTESRQDDRYWRLAGLFWWAVVLLSAFSLLVNYYKVALEPFQSFGRELINWIGAKGLTVLFIVVATLIAYRFIPHLARRFSLKTTEEFSRQQVRIQTLRSVLESVLGVLIIVIGALFALSNLGLNITALLAGAGVVGLGISLAAQNLIRDVLNGFFILLEDQYGVGDVITVGQVSGGVEKFNLRLTVLRDLEGKVHFIPNSTITQVTVMSRDWARAVIDVQVAYETPVDKALEVVKAEADAFYQHADWKDKFTDQPPEVLGVQQLGDFGMLIRVLFNSKPKEQWAIGREFRRRIKLRLDSEGIEIPYPTRKIINAPD